MLAIDACVCLMLMLSRVKRVYLQSCVLWLGTKLAYVGEGSTGVDAS